MLQATCLFVYNRCYGLHFYKTNGELIITYLFKYLFSFFSFVFRIVITGLSDFRAKLSKRCNLFKIVCDDDQKKKKVFIESLYFLVIFCLYLCTWWERESVVRYSMVNS